jgi:hypothetical protein
MIRVDGMLAVGVLAACLWISAGIAAAADDATQPEGKPAATAKPAKADSTVKQTTSAAVKPKPRELSPAMANLRDVVRQTLAVHQKQPYNTQENTATEILNYCLAFGCGTEVWLGGSEGQRVNGITCLCWGYPCGGYEMLRVNQDHIAARIGYGYQERSGEFVAMLALSRVPPNYPVRAGKTTRTVADVIEAEKLTCRANSDLSLKLLGLAHYVEVPDWKNDLGETWSIERMIQEELAQPVVTAPEGGLNRLMGLSYAVSQRSKHGLPVDGQFERARKYTAEFHRFALQLQNDDGSWGPYFLAARSAGPDAASQLRPTGRILEWLVVSLPDGKLEDQQLAKSVEYVAGLLGSQRFGWNTPSLSTQEIAAVGHALHALDVYDDRVFKPVDPPAGEKPAAEQSAAASRDVGTTQR